MKIRLTLLSMVLIAASGASRAATYDLVMNGDSTPSYVYQAQSGGELYTFTDFDLTTSAPGSVVPGATVFPNDVFSGVLTMSGPVTMPASLPTSDLGIVLEGIDDENMYVAIEESVSLYLGGKPVDISTFTHDGVLVDGGALSLDVLGGWFTPSPALTFDEITFTAQITDIYGDDGTSVGSGLLDASVPYLYFQTYASLTTVSEMQSGWLMMAGLALIGAIARRRRAWRFGDARPGFA